MIELETRKVVLLEEITEKKEKKIKILRTQKDELKMHQVGLETCLIFGNQLIKEGNPIEISLSREYFLKRIDQLKNENVQLESGCDPLITFFEVTSSAQRLSAAISQYGSILDQDISPKNSFISSINLVSPSSSSSPTNIFASTSPSTKVNPELVKIQEKQQIEIGITCCDANENQFDKNICAAGIGIFHVTVDPPQANVKPFFLFLFGV